MTDTVFVGTAPWIGAAPGADCHGLYRLNSGGSWREHALPEGVQGVYALACP